MNKLFQNIPFELPKPHSPKEKHKSSLNAIVGGQYMNKLNQKLSPLKKRKLIKKHTKKKEKQPQTANQNWNDWRFQIHWNIIEWVNLLKFNKQTNVFCVSSKEFYLNDNIKTAHWVDQKN